MRSSHQLRWDADRPSHIVLDDMTISNRHLRIYSIIYDLNDLNIDPFVYAEDISTNGSRWLPKIRCPQMPYSIGKNRAFLLSDGDRMLLNDHVSFEFSCTSIKRLPQTDQSNETQELEKDVSYVLVYRLLKR